MIQTIQTTKIFKQILEAERDGYSVIKLQGGSRSSKTWSIFQFWHSKAIKGESGDVTITRMHLQLLKDTLIQDFTEQSELYNLPISPEINTNRSSQRYTFNKFDYLFWGLDKPRKAHGKKQKYTWMNEVMEIENKSVFDQLEQRTEGLMILDYNPSDEDHWVFGLDKRPDVITLKSTMLDNPFLPIKIRNKILSYDPSNPENIKNGTADFYMWQVYGLGNPAKLEGLIFDNWEEIPEVPEGARSLGLGLDFGFANDPASLTEIYLHNQTIIIDELIYETGLTNVSVNEEEETLTKRMTELGITYKDGITADSAEAKSIRELKNAGFNITGADKSNDSVRYGIDLMKSYKICYTKRSVGLAKEIRKYKWATDANGNIIKRRGKAVPIDAFNHSIDSSRYRISKVLGKKGKVQILPSFG